VEQGTLARPLADLLDLEGLQLIDPFAPSLPILSTGSRSLKAALVELVEGLVEALAVETKEAVEAEAVAVAEFFGSPLIL
jgi:hypothetical protein